MGSYAVSLLTYGRGYGLIMNLGSEEIDLFVPHAEFQETYYNERTEYVERYPK